MLSMGSAHPRHKVPPPAACLAVRGASQARSAWPRFVPGRCTIRDTDPAGGVRRAGGGTRVGASGVSARTGRRPPLYVGGAAGRGCHGLFQGRWGVALRATRDTALGGRGGGLGVWRMQGEEVLRSLSLGPLGCSCSISRWARAPTGTRATSKTSTEATPWLASTTASQARPCLRDRWRAGIRVSRAPPGHSARAVRTCCRCGACRRRAKDDVGGGSVCADTGARLNS